MRTIGEIVDQVMATIPEDHVNDFDGLIYTAPEMMGEFIKRFNEVVPLKPTEEWHYLAIAALTLMSVDQVRAKFNREVN
jgi:hypothetical protein